MKVYILIDAPDYEGSTVLAAYLDEAKAEQRLKRMVEQRRRWQEKQRELDEKGSDESWTNPPHSYDDLTIHTMEVIK
jgi:hypothetical protein